MAPSIFDQQAKDGSRFRCSDSFLRKWLHETLRWSERKATRAAQKIPENWEVLCLRAFYRIAHGIRDNDIPAELIVNSDQTQAVLAQGTNLTWAKTGAKQVSIIGADEKRAFTVVVSVAASGFLLPYQAIYQGYTKRSCPNPDTAANYTEANNLGIQFEFSSTDTYWSTLGTMKLFVDRILVPYFSEQKRRLGLPQTQKSLWLIDAWAVHRSKEFLEWMKKHHPGILIRFVPAGTTGLFQPCDVGIQRVFKHSLKRSFHENIVEEMLAQIDEGKETIMVEKKLAILRDRTPKWLCDAYKTVNKPEIVKKVCNCFNSLTCLTIVLQAFEMCRAGKFNLSYESLTSFDARENLRNMKNTDLEFWIELTGDTGISDVDENIAQEGDPHLPDITEFDDDSDLPCGAIIASVTGLQHSVDITRSADGDLLSSAQTEFLDGQMAEALSLGVTGSVGEHGVEELGVGKRKRRGNTLYQSAVFWRHEDA
jgi:hypothetical protein